MSASKQSVRFGSLLTRWWQVKKHGQTFSGWSTQQDKLLVCHYHYCLLLLASLVLVACRDCTLTIMFQLSYYHYFASAAIAVDSSHMTASSSAASWSRFGQPSNFVNGHVSAMWFMVCRWPQSQEGDWRDPISDLKEQRWEHLQNNKYNY